MKKLIRAVGKVGWLPFWYGNKYNKRLVSKRIRAYNKKHSLDN